MSPVDKTKKNKMGPVDIISLVLIILMLPPLFFNCVLIAKGFIDKTTVPSVFGFSPLAVETNSMEPVFSGGDLILIKKTDIESLQIDDVISYYEPTVQDHSVVVTHRIVDITVNDDGLKLFTTKGDANNVNDSNKIPESEIVGEYIGHIDNAGKLVMFMSTSTGVLVCVVLPFAVIIGVDYLVKFICKHKQKKDNN